MKRLGMEICGLAVLTASTTTAQVTQRVSLTSVSVESGGNQGGWGSYDPSISADGRYVAFESAWLFAPASHAENIFVRDRRTGATELVSVASDGSPSNLYGDSYTPFISGDGRIVAFTSRATNFVPGDTNGVGDVFVRDRQTHTTERVSIDSSGAQANGESYAYSISPDGRFVAFSSDATNLVPGDLGGFYDVFLRDRRTSTTELVSVSSSGAQGNGHSYNSSVSADGRFVAFLSDASNLVQGDTNQFTDVFVRDRASGTTERVSVGMNGQTNWYTSWYTPAVTPDGRYVAFDWSVCDACSRDVYVRDRQVGTTELVSASPSGGWGNDESGGQSISDDGRYVAFGSLASNLVSGDTNGWGDVFVRDRQLGTTERASVDSTGTQGNGQSGAWIFGVGPSMSAGARCVAFESEAGNLVPDDTNGTWDIFVRERSSTEYESLCEPGFSGAVSCPCANPPSSRGRGCDNSAATGGARLSVGGGSYLSSDSLFFTTDSETSSALSIVVQGTSSLPNGAVFGQGVRCVRGTLTRLYAKTASAGSITAPDFQAGEPTIHTRSAALGDPLLPGSRRWYMVWYRDATVLGGCPASSTFNTTQAKEVSWTP